VCVCVCVRVCVCVPGGLVYNPPVTISINCDRVLSGEDERKLSSDDDDDDYDDYATGQR